MKIISGIDRLLSETMTADVAPVLTSTPPKKPRPEEEDEDDDKPVLAAESLINALLEDCPCNLIPDDAEPVAGTQLKGVDDQLKPESESPKGNGDALDTILGEDKKPTPPVQPIVESTPQTRDDIYHRMVRLTSPKRHMNVTDATIAESQAVKVAAQVSTSSILHSIGASAPTMPVPTGTDEDAEAMLHNSANLMETVAAAATPGAEMPAHKMGDGVKIFNTFRRFNRG